MAIRPGVEMGDASDEDNITMKLMVRFWSQGGFFERVLLTLRVAIWQQTWWECWGVALWRWAVPAMRITCL